MMDFAALYSSYGFWEDRHANLYPGKTHRDAPPLAWCDVI
jgi:hypothetical protein